MNKFPANICNQTLFIRLYVYTCILTSWTFRKAARRLHSDHTDWLMLNTIKFYSWKNLCQLPVTTSGFCLLNNPPPFCPFLFNSLQFFRYVFSPSRSLRFILFWGSFPLKSLFNNSTLIHPLMAPQVQSIRYLVTWQVSLRQLFLQFG